MLYPLSYRRSSHQRYLFIPPTPNCAGTTIRRPIAKVHHESEKCTTSQKRRGRPASVTWRAFRRVCQAGDEGDDQGMQLFFLSQGSKAGIEKASPIHPGPKGVTCGVAHGLGV